MMKYLTYTWYLVQTFKSASPAYCKTPATSFDFVWPIDQPGRNKKPYRQIKYKNCIALLQPIDTEPRIRRGRLGT